MVKVGDQILVRSRALICGDEYNVNDSFVALGAAPDNCSTKHLAHLGSHCVFSWNAVEDDCVTLVTIVAIVRFPHDVRNLDHFHVMMPDGQIVRIYDDRLNGYWMDTDVTPKKMRSSFNKWLHSYDFKDRFPGPRKSWSKEHR